MTAFTLPAQSAYTATLGFIIHWSYFIHGENDLSAANIARLHSLAICILMVIKTRLVGISFYEASLQTCLLATIYAGAIFASMLFYRNFLSPLSHIPGPTSMRLTKLSHVWKQAWYRNCEVLEELHQQYGDVVRTGPNEVTLFGTDAYKQVHGKNSKCTKSVYYDMLHPMVSIDTERDPVTHAQRRKVWDQGFSFRALEKLERLVYDKADLLVKQLRHMGENPVDVTEWLEYYTFDLMGEFGLTIQFNNLERGTPHPILELYHVAHHRMGPFGAAPWIKHLLMGIPYIERMRYFRMFMEWSTKELLRNIKDVSRGRTDIIGYVIDAAKKNGGVEQNWCNILGDFVVVIAAGSDPMRQVLVNMMYHLIRQPGHLAQIRQELLSIDVRDYTALQSLPHLNACIYETLRLDPAVPSAGIRVAPVEGLKVAGKFVPGGTTIITPQYSLFRDPRNFVRPTEWIPERFSTRPDLILDESAFVPWSTGKYSCIGKNLSLIEIRVAAALIFTNFNFEFAPGEDGRRMFDEASDYFTTTPGPLHLVMNRID